MVLRLVVEGPEEEVRTFLKDFSILPQHRIVATSVPYEDDELSQGEVQILCHLQHIPLSEINEPISVTFQTKDGKYLNVHLLSGHVIRDGDIISVTGRAAAGLLRE
jgi:hypothetical protein